MNINTLADLQKNGISPETYWSARILKMIVLEKKNFVFTGLGEEKIIPLNEGTKSFTARRYNHLPYDGVGKHNLTEGKAPESMKVEAHKVTGSVTQKGVVIEQTDVSADVHFDNIKTIYQPELARHAAEVIERNIIDSFADASEYFVGTNSTSANDITASDIVTLKDFRVVTLSMKNYRRQGHKKYGGKFVNVLHTNVMQDLLDDDVLVNKALVPGNENTPIINGTLASYKIYDMYFIETLIAEVTPNSSDVNVYTSYSIGNEAYMVIKLGSGNVKFLTTGFTAEKSDPLGQIATAGYKLWTGSKVTDPMAITKVYSACSYDVTADFTNDDWGRAADQSGAGSL